jgi:hypothetical protein
MKKPVAYALLASPVFLALGMSPAAAASPAYCALYAREYAAARIGMPVPGDAAGAQQRVEDQAYYRCLNQDEAPQFPSTSAYFGAPLSDIIGTDDGPFQAVQAKKTAVATAKAVTAPAAAAGTAAQPTEVADAAPTPPVAVATHGAPTPWTPEWVTWCKAHYRSFNETTGYVLTLTHEKKMCP